MKHRMTVFTRETEAGITAVIMIDGEVIHIQRDLNNEQFSLVVEALQRLNPFVIIEKLEQDL